MDDTSARDEQMSVRYLKTEHGTQIWKDENGLAHRDDGPAVISSNGDRFWYRHGVYHREDGPAVEWANGDKEWCLNDIFYEPMMWMLKIYEANLSNS